MKPPLRHSGSRRRRRGAFTLVELLVVMGVILVLMVLVLPNIQKMLTSGSMDQARAVMGASLAATRALAMEKQTYALVHVQPHQLIALSTYSKNRPSGGEYWLITLLLDPTSGQFKAVPGYRAERLPRNVGAGEVDSRFIDTSTGDYNSIINGVTSPPFSAGWQDFTSFNVIFGPDGTLVRDVNGNPPQISPTVPAFRFQYLAYNTNTGQNLVNERGVRAMTFFDYPKLNVISGRAEELNESGQFLVINPYTGRLLQAE